MKKIALCMIGLLGAALAVAQNWSPVGGGVNGASAVTTWALCSYDSVLYAGGEFNTAGNTSVNDIAQWNGTNWSSLGLGTKGYINAMAIYNGNLYVGGEFDSIGGIKANDIAMWNGSSWSVVGKGIKDDEYGVYSLAVYNGALYAGGSFDSADGKAIFGIAKWNGSNWSSLGTGVYAADEDDGVFTLAVYNGELYAGGGFDSAGGIPVKEIARWNGTSWLNVGKSVNDGGSIFTLAVYNGNLYAGGMFDTAGGIPVNRIAMWNGSIWFPLDLGITGEATWATVNKLISYNNELYVGGYFDTVNDKPINCIAKWNGTSWSSLGTGISNGGSVAAMAVYNNELYVGGGFDSAGGVYAKNIAMWNGPNGVEGVKDQAQLNVYPNPVANTLYVSSSIAGSNTKYSIYNELGQEFQEGRIVSNISKIDVSDFTPGLYLLSVLDGNKQYNYKFIKN